MKSLELPGGIRIEFPDLEKAKLGVEKAGLLAQPEQAQPAYLLVAEQDPNLALAGLRIEVERRLRSIGVSRGIDGQRESMPSLMRRLFDVKALSEQEYDALLGLVKLLNNAVHGADVDPRAVDWALDVGPRIIAALDKRMMT